LRASPPLPPPPTALLSLHFVVVECNKLKRKIATYRNREKFSIAVAAVAAVVDVDVEFAVVAVDGIQILMQFSPEDLL